VYDAISAEEMGKPAVVLCNNGFATDARSAASGKGIPGLRVVPEGVPCECSVKEEIDFQIEMVIPAIIDALAKPLTDDESNPKPREIEQHSRTVFQGDLDEVNRFFYRRGWADGFPILPPTEAKVAEMLTGTDLASDHLLGKLIPRGGKITVEKLAVNAVMAGALPTYMPVLIAAVEALLDPRAAFGTFEVSTGSWSPFYIINGSVRHDIHVNYSSGMLSPGNLANAAIGRAMGLIVKNIGGARKGVEDMGVFGNPGKYTLVAGENEEESLWEPLHVEQGFKKSDNAVTVFCPNTFDQILTYGTDVKGILSTPIYNISAGRGQDGFTCLILNPGHAATLAKAGWTKNDIKTYISENATTQYYRLRQYLSGGKGGPGQLNYRLPLNGQDPIRLIQNKDSIMILVAGGPGAFMCILTGARGFYGNKFVTKAIHLPANWDSLVKKYSGLAPSYVRY
jgi:hypothetical protein